MGRAGTTRKRPGASIADIRAVRGGFGYGGSDGSGAPTGHLAVVDGTLAASTQEVINRFTPRASARLTLLAANSGVQRSPVPVARRARCRLCVRQNPHAGRNRAVCYGCPVRMAAGIVRHTGFDRHLCFGLRWPTDERFEQLSADGPRASNTGGGCTMTTGVSAVDGLRGLCTARKGARGTRRDRAGCGKRSDGAMRFAGESEIRTLSPPKEE